MNRRLRSALAARGRPEPESPSGASSPGAGGAGGPIGKAGGPSSAIPGPLVLDLVAALVQGGAPPSRALRDVGAALQVAGDPRGDGLSLAAGRTGQLDAERGGAGGELAPPAPGADRLAEVLTDALALAARSGLPPTALLRRSAAEERRRQAAVRSRAVRRLEVLLVVPAGLCLLPAFVLLGVVPVVLDLVFG